MKKSKDYKTFTVEPLDIKFPSLTILENTKLTVKFGEHYILLGKNGIGKTSLLTAIADKTIAVPNDLDLVYVKQEEPESNLSVLETLLSTNVEYYQVQKRYEELEQLILQSEDYLDEYNNVSLLINAEHLKVKVMAQKILFGLGFSKQHQDYLIPVFSGGWRMRISLAKALFMTPTLLLLDEPTNHLDLSAVLWLIEYLKSYPKTFIVVSHDQYFIQSIGTTIINIKNKQLYYYKGSYDKFQCQLKLEIDKHQRDWNLYEKQLAQLKNKYGGNSETVKCFVEARKISRPEKQSRMKIKFLQPKLIKGSVINLQDVSFSYDNRKSVIHNLNLDLSMSSRIAIMGNNGIGKSTILKLIAGVLNPTTGNISRSPNLRIGYYDQHFEKSLPFEVSPAKYLASLNETVNEQLLHKYLAMFGLESKYHQITIGNLSGGQKARVKFASFGVIEPHLLILDELTNHLDVETVESLIVALNDFEGSIILATHNYTLITGMAAVLYTMTESGLQKYENSYEDYISEIRDAHEDYIS